MAEGRNGVWLAEQGLDVLSVDGSAAAQDKARRLALYRRGVRLRLELADLTTWAMPRQALTWLQRSLSSSAGQPCAGACSKA